MAVVENEVAIVPGYSNRCAKELLNGGHGLAEWSNEPMGWGLKRLLNKDSGCIKQNMAVYHCSCFLVCYLELQATVRFLNKHFIWLIGKVCTKVLPFIHLGLRRGG